MKDAKFWVIAICVAGSIGTIESSFWISAGFALSGIAAVLLIRGDEA
jgi:hypothetical protein